jgi:NAD(P)-dependent dehydrogenase (short-subunit alcohol dehydrogenase family)
MRQVLVTGGGARIGQEICLAIAKAGFRPVIHYFGSRDGAEETRATIEARGGDASIIQADLSQGAASRDLIPQVVDRFGPLIGLINNASLFEPDELGQLTEAGWDRHFAVNVKAPAFLAQAFAAQLPEGKQGHIINLLDQRLAKLNPTFFSYTLSKAALDTATTTMAQALAPSIRVNAVSPGPTLKNARQSDADFATQQKSSLLGHGSSSQEISRAVLFLLQSGAITGQTLIVDGGQHLIWETADIAGLRE